MSREELSPRGCQRVYRVMCYVAASDGSIPEQERRLLERYREELGLEPDQAAALEEEALAKENLQLGTDKAERRAATTAMAELMASDGVLHPEEAARVKRIARSLGISDRRLTKTLKRALLGLNEDELD